MCTKSLDIKQALRYVLLLLKLLLSLPCQLKQTREPPFLVECLRTINHFYRLKRKQHITNWVSLCFSLCFQFLQQYDGEVDGGSWMFHCLLCNHSSLSKLQLLKHSQTPTHQQREGLLQLQPMGGEELAAIFTIRKSPDDVTGMTALYIWIVSVVKESESECACVCSH